MMTTMNIRNGTSQALSRPWPVFRARHGSRIVCMSHIMNVDMNVDMKITPVESLLRMDADVLHGSRMVSRS